jgi:hypothetical protein
MALWVVSFNMSAAVQHKSFAGKFFRLPPCGSVDFSGVQSEEISLNFHVFYKKIDQSGARLSRFGKKADKPPLF